MDDNKLPMDEEQDDVISLVDEEGNEDKFQHIGTIEHEGKYYIALVPVFDTPEEVLEDDGELVILRLDEDENGEEMLVSIDDDEEYETVAAIFEDELADEYDVEE